MQQRLYQIYDRVAKMLCGGAMVQRHDGPAVRQFFDSLGDERSGIASHPGDFDLLCVGLQDDTTGKIETEGYPIVVVTGEEWIKTKEREARAQLALLPENK